LLLLLLKTTTDSLAKLPLRAQQNCPLLSPDQGANDARAFPG
jgi:hypothetical protein